MTTEEVADSSAKQQSELHYFTLSNSTAALDCGRINALWTTYYGSFQMYCISVHSGRYQFRSSLYPFRNIWRSVSDIYKQNVNLWIKKLCSLRTQCLERSAMYIMCIIHNIRTVSFQVVFLWPFRPLFWRSHSLWKLLVTSNGLDSLSTIAGHTTLNQWYHITEITSRFHFLYFSIAANYWVWENM